MFDLVVAVGSYCCVLRQAALASKEDNVLQRAATHHELRQITERSGRYFELWDDSTVHGHGFMRVTSAKAEGLSSAAFTERVTARQRAER